MKDEARRGDNLYPRVASKLSAPLVRAVAGGDREAIDLAILEQPLSPETEMISNRLVARAFFVEEKGELLVLHDRLAGEQTTQGAIRQVRHYLRALKENFVATFVADEGGNELEKLTGDRLFREALQQPGDEGLRLAQHLMEVDVTTLTSADGVLHWAKSTRDSITAALWETVQDMREGSADTEALSVALTEEIARLDQCIMMTLQQI